VLALTWGEFGWCRLFWLESGIGEEREGRKICSLEGPCSCLFVTRGHFSGRRPRKIRVTEVGAYQDSKFILHHPTGIDESECLEQSD